MKILWAKTWGQHEISILVPTWAQKQPTKSKVLAHFQLPTWAQKQQKNARFRAFLPKNQRFSTIFNCPPGYRNNQKTRVFARFYPKIKGFRPFSTRDNCGTDNCGTDNCGTENCGTENCGTETCGIICFFLFHTFLCVHMLFSAMLAYSRDFSRMYTWFTYFC